MTPQEDAQLLRSAAAMSLLEGVCLCHGGNVRALLRNVAGRLETATYAEPEKPALDWSKPLRTVAGGDTEVLAWSLPLTAFENRRVFVRRGNNTQGGIYTKEGWYEGMPDHEWNLTNTEE